MDNRLEIIDINKKYGNTANYALIKKQLKQYQEEYIQHFDNS